MLRNIFLILFLSFFSLHATAWEYTFERSDYNTSVGVLKYCGDLIDPRLGTVQTPIGCFTFFTYKDIWEKSGWIRCDLYSVRETDAVFNYDTLGHKWYTGAHMACTPKHWCYVVNEDVWLNPEHIKEYCDIHIPKRSKQYAQKSISIHREPEILRKKKIYKKLSNTVSLRTSKKWEYFIRYDVKSNNTGRRGTLLYNNEGIPQMIGILTTPIGTYIFKEKRYKYEDHGWFLIPDVQLSTTEKIITQKEMKRKYYSGSYKKETPENWCFSVFYNIWLDPDMLSGSALHTILDIK